MSMRLDVCVVCPNCRQSTNVPFSYPYCTASCRLEASVPADCGQPDATATCYPICWKHLL